MHTRLTPSDLSFLSGETRTTPMHNVTVEVFRGGAEGMDYDTLKRLIADRLPLVPRYRQRLQQAPGYLSTPRWVDDPDFDLNYHIRRSALPGPGTREQLLELTERIISRQLDRSRPLWEIYFVEGLEGERVAVLAKSHQLLVDGVATVDIGQVMLDLKPDTDDLDPDDPWSPTQPPTAAGEVVDVVKEAISRPRSIARTVRANADAVGRTAGSAVHQVGVVANALANRRTDPDSPLFAELSQQRRVVTVSTDLKDYRTVRAEHGGTVNDVIMASIAGGIRNWLMTRAERLGETKHLRALVPMSVIDDDLEATSLGTQIAAHRVMLPIREASPVVRLHQVSYAFKAHGEARRAVAANRLAGIAGFAPTTFHALGSRLAATEGANPFDIAITNVPGPQFPLYAANAQMIETYPVPPLLQGHALAIGVTSYNGRVFYGITADRDSVPDADTLGQCIQEAVEELVDTTGTTRQRAPRGRRTPKRTRS